MNILHQIIRHPQLLRSVEQLVLGHGLETANLCLHHTHVAHCLHDIAGARFALGTNHGSALIDTAQCLAQILGTANKRYIELGLVDVVLVICRREHFALVDVVNLDGLQNLCLCEVTDPALCHNRNADCLLNAPNHLRVAHTGYTAGCTDVCRNALQRHNGTSAGCLCDLCLLRCGDVHNDAALQHLRQVFIQFITISHGSFLLCDFCTFHTVLSLVYRRFGIAAIASSETFFNASWNIRTSLQGSQFI